MMKETACSAHEMTGPTKEIQIALPSIGKGPRTGG